MSLTQGEIMEALGLSGMSGARAVVELSKRDLDDYHNALVFRQFAGDDAEIPNRVGAVVGYLVYDAAMGKPLDVAGCIARAAKLDSYNFSDAARAEREAAKTARAEKAAAKAAEKAEKAAQPRETVNPDGTITRKRGRPPAGTKTVWEQVRELYVAAADKSKEAMLPMLQEKLGLVHGTAQTYWYKAKKEIGA